MYNYSRFCLVKFLHQIGEPLLHHVKQLRMKHPSDAKIFINHSKESISHRNVLICSEFFDCRHDSQMADHGEVHSRFENQKSNDQDHRQHKQQRNGHLVTDSVTFTLLRRSVGAILFTYLGLNNGSSWHTGVKINPLWWRFFVVNNFDFFLRAGFLLFLVVRWLLFCLTEQRSKRFNFCIQFWYEFQKWPQPLGSFGIDSSSGSSVVSSGISLISAIFNSNF